MKGCQAEGEEEVVWCAFGVLHGGPGTLSSPVLMGMLLTWDCLRTQSVVQSLLADPLALRKSPGACKLWKWCWISVSAGVLNLLVRRNLSLRVHAVQRTSGPSVRSYFSVTATTHAAYLRPLSLYLW